MTDDFTLSRRQLLKASAGAALGLASSALPLGAARAASATIGFIYVGPRDDYGYSGMGQYLHGIVAGNTTKSKKLGFVAAKPIPQVLLNINSFLLGARTVDPTITCQVVFTGEWSLAVKEAEATNALVDQGADVITCHVDSPKVVV